MESIDETYIPVHLLAFHWKMLSTITSWITRQIICEGAPNLLFRFIFYTWDHSFDCLFVCSNPVQTTVHMNATKCTQLTWSKFPLTWFPPLSCTCGRSHTGLSDESLCFLSEDHCCFLCYAFHYCFPLVAVHCLHP